MDTIQWIVGLIPKSARPLFAVLLIGMSVLASVLAYVYKDLQSKLDERKYLLISMTRECEHKTDSLNKVILQLKDDSKREVINRLEQIIREQKDQIKSQHGELLNQNVVKQANNKLIERYK